MHLGARVIGQHLLHRPDELARDRVEHVAHNSPFAFARVAGFARDQLCVVAPAPAIAQLHPGPRQRIENLLDRTRRILPCHDRAQAREALLGHGIDDLAKHRMVKAILGTKMVADQGKLDTCRRSDLAHGNAVVAALGEQPLGRTQDTRLRCLALRSCQNTPFCFRRYFLLDD